MKKSTKYVLLLAFLLYLAAPFFILPDHAMLISIGSVLIVTLCFIFYIAATILFVKTEVGAVERPVMGLPGEQDNRKGKTSEKKKLKVNIDTKLPGVLPKESNSGPEFDIDDTNQKQTVQLPQVSEIDLTRSMLELISLWDGLSFYKIKDSEVYNSETVKIIGEVYDSVFGGLATYLQRYKLTLDDLLSEDLTANDYEQPLYSIVVGFIISLIEREVAKNLHMHIEKAEVIIPKAKVKNQNLGKVIMAPEFKYQILLLIRKYYEKQESDYEL